MNYVWIFLEKEWEAFEGIWRGTLSSKPLISNSPKLGEFRGRVEGPRVVSLILK